MSTNNKQVNNSCVTTYRGLTETEELEEDSGDAGGSHNHGRKDFGSEIQSREDFEETGELGSQGKAREDVEIAPGQCRSYFGMRGDLGQNRVECEVRGAGNVVLRGLGQCRGSLGGREVVIGLGQGQEELYSHEETKETLSPSETFVRLHSGRVVFKDVVLTSTETFARAQGGRTISKEVPLSSAEALVRLLNRTMYPIVQENGQRRYGPPPDWQGLQPPQRGCEVFIGKIPRDCFEDELVPVFERIGPIYMFRLMMDFTGTNRGYGFCIYMNRDDTKRAVSELNNYEIRRDKPLGVCLSVDNCRLFVGGIPKNKTKEEIFQEMNRVTEGVKDVIAYPSVADKTKNRGFSFVEYDSHKSAAMARRKLIPGRIQLWGQQIAVDWAEPEREVNEDIMSSVKILYVRNLMLTTTEETLREKFIHSADGPPDCVERVKKIKDYAFIHFKERFYAEMSLRVLNNTQIDNSWVEVSWAKPADKSESSKNKTVNSNGDSPHPEVFQPNQIFIDSSSGISYIGAPIQNLQSQPLVTSSNSPNRTRTGRRNAAGSRSITNNREKKAAENSEENHNNAIWPNAHKCEVDMNGIRYQYIPTQMLFPGLNIMPASGNNQNHEELKSITEQNDSLNHQNNISHEESILSISHLNPSIINSNIPSNIDHNCQSVYLNVLNPLQQYQGFPNQTFQIPQSQPFSYAMTNFYPQMSQTYPMMSHQVPQMSATSNSTMLNSGYGQPTISMIPVAINQMIDYSMNPVGSTYGLENTNYLFPNPISHIPNSSSTGTVQNVPIIVPISNPPNQLSSSHPLT